MAQFLIWSWYYLRGTINMANGDITLTMRIDGLDKLKGDFERAGVNYRSLFAQAMRNATTRLKNDMQDAIRQNGTTFQGSLGRSIQVHEASYDKGVVGVGERYGAVIEFGRKPGKMPPVAPLERWANLKLGQPGIGFLVARKIAAVGTKAQPFVEPTFAKDGDYVLRQFTEAAEMLISRLAGNN
jgi:phage gpG-like protein